MVLSSVKTLVGGGESGGRSVHIDLVGAGPAVSLEEIRDVLLRHPGESPVYFTVREGSGPGTTQIRAKRLLVRPSDELLQALRERLGNSAVRVANGHAAAVPF